MGREDLHIPRALFDSEAQFNPCQYHPFFEVMEWNDGENKYAWNEKSLLITDEVGVGKTYETGIILQELYKRGCKILIFCPVKLCDSWCTKMEDFGLNFINYKEEKQLSRLTVLPYSAFYTKEFSEETEQEEINRIAKEENTSEKGLLLEELEYDVLVLDEAHYIRNGSGVYYRRIRELIEKNEQEHPKLKIFLTGTPIFNKEEDFNNIRELLRYGGKEESVTGTTQGVANLYDKELQVFECDTFFSSKEREIYEVIDSGIYGQVTGFLKKLSVSSFYSLKEWLNEGEEEQQKAVAAMNKDAITQNLTNITTLQAGETYEELKKRCAEWNEEEDSKFRGLLKLLEKMKEKDTAENFKVVIFTCFIKTADYLKKRLEKYHVYSILGSTKANETKDIIENFKKREEPSVMICSEAAREGQDMQFCHYLVHYDYPYTPAAIGQRNGRIYRRGQEHQPSIYYMKTNDWFFIGKNGFYYDRSYDDRLFGEIVVEKSYLIDRKSKEQGIVRVPIIPEMRFYYLPEHQEDFMEKPSGSMLAVKQAAVKSSIRSRLREVSEEEMGETGLPEAEVEALLEFLGVRLELSVAEKTMGKQENLFFLTKDMVKKVVTEFYRSYGLDIPELEEGSVLEWVQALVQALVGSEEWTKEEIKRRNAEQYKEMLKRFLLEIYGSREEEKDTVRREMDGLGNDAEEIRSYENAKLDKIKENYV